MKRKNLKEKLIAFLHKNKFIEDHQDDGNRDFSIKSYRFGDKQLYIYLRIVLKPKPDKFFKKLYNKFFSNIALSDIKVLGRRGYDINKNGNIVVIPFNE